MSRPAAPILPSSPLAPAREDIADILADLVAAGLPRCDVADLARRLGRWVERTQVSGTHVWDGQATVFVASAWRTLDRLQMDLDEVALDLDLLPHGIGGEPVYGDPLAA